MTNMIRGAESNPAIPETPDPRETPGGMLCMESPLQNLYVILRCNRWGLYVRWLANPGGVSDPRPQRVQSWWFKLVMVGKVQQVVSLGRRRCPVDILEAEETGRCVSALPTYLKDAIVEEYVVGGTAQQKASALGIEQRAFRHRRGVAHGELLGLFNDAAVGLPLVCTPAPRMQPPRSRPTA